MSAGLSIHPVNAEQLAAHANELARLYRLCFAGPPWNEPPAQLAKFPQRLADQLAHPGAGGVVTTGNGRVIAAIYGWPAAPELPVASAFDQALAAAVTPNVASRLTAPALVIVELMVDPGHRRRGIARQLLAAYTSGWPCAWLCTHPQAPAAALYRALGWREEATFQVGDSPVLLFTSPAR